MNIKCISCKGRGFCGRVFCPILAKSDAVFKISKQMPGKDFQGNSPAPFIGHYGYPYLNVGVLSLNGNNPDSWLYDAPRHWAKENFDIPSIVNFRSALINSRFKAHAHDSNKMIEISQEVGMSNKPVDIEVNLKDKPKFRINSDSYVAPTGPFAELEKIQITSNPSIHTKVDKVVSDIDLKANDSLIYLYENEFDENFLSKLLSVGTVGIKRDRKLVPTRWSITAVDDNIGKYLIERIKDYQKTDYKAFFGGYLGNYYLILFFPEVWSYELFETYLPKASWNQTEDITFMTDYEGYSGRKDYADNTVGGYYAARLSILEKLDSLKKQGSVLTLRFITGEYAVPLGVWVVREAVRKAMAAPPLTFSDKDLMLNYAKILVKKKFGYDIDNIFKESILYNQLKNQSKLNQFFIS